MARSTVDTWLTGPGDLEIDEVQDVPVVGQSVLVRGLPAAYSNQASSEALKLVSGRRGEQMATIDQARMEIIQFAQGCVEPTFTETQAETIAKKYGPAFKKVVAKIDELSGVDKEAIEQAQATFPAGPGGEGRQDVGDGTPTGSS